MGASPNDTSTKTVSTTVAKVSRMDKIAAKKRNIEMDKERGEEKRTTEKKNRVMRTSDRCEVQCSAVPGKHKATSASNEHKE